MLERKVEAAAFVVTVSRYNRDQIAAECGGDAGRRVHVIHCGVDPQFFRYRSRRREGPPFELVCVASLEEVKGHRHLIEACRILRDLGIGFRCHLVGDGPLRREVRDQVDAARLDDRVLIHGPQPRAEVAHMLFGADLAVLASCPTVSGKREGIPVSLMEAMSTGLPVVSTRISGIPELVESGKEGILVLPGDPVALAEALGRLLRNPALRERMGRAARARIVEQFELRKNAGRLLDLIVEHGGDELTLHAKESHA